MLTIEPTGVVLGAVAHGIDLAQPLGERDMGAILLAPGRHGGLRFPDQSLGLGDLKRFSEQFGEIQGPVTRGATRRKNTRRSTTFRTSSGRQVHRQPDAGQDWHTDSLLISSGNAS
jgi:alpha-ketoglutarate-dependent taurine dioxygenase